LGAGQAASKLALEATKEQKTLSNWHQLQNASRTDFKMIRDPFLSPEMR